MDNQINKNHRHPNQLELYGTMEMSYSINKGS